MTDIARPNPNEADLATQVEIARRFPRDIEASLKRIEKIVTATPKIAASMYYSLPRKNKKTGKTTFVEGPSIRFAEVAASQWGNMRTMAIVTEIGDRFVKAQAICFDCENNYAEQEEIQRRLYSQSDDMILQTCASAISVAKRNATIRVIGRALLDPVYERARHAAMGKRTIAESWTQCAAAFVDDWEIDAASLLQIVNVPDESKLTQDHILRLRGIYTALRDGQTSVADVLGRAESKPGVEV